MDMKAITSSLPCVSCVKTNRHCCTMDLPLDFYTAAYLIKLYKDRIDPSKEFIIVNSPHAPAKFNVIPKDISENSTISWLPCVFLVDGSCSVYEDRPEICRMYGTSFIRCRFEASGVTPVNDIPTEEIKKLDHIAFENSILMKILENDGTVF